MPKPTAGDVNLPANRLNRRLRLLALKARCMLKLEPRSAESMVWARTRSNAYANAYLPCDTSGCVRIHGVSQRRGHAEDNGLPLAGSSWRLAFARRREGQEARCRRLSGHAVPAGPAVCTAA